MKKILILLIAVFTATTTFAQRNHTCVAKKCSGTIGGTIKVGETFSNSTSGITVGSSCKDDCDLATAHTGLSIDTSAIDNSTPGSYTITATCDQGCQVTGTVTVEAVCNPTFSVTISNAGPVSGGFGGTSGTISFTVSSNCKVTQWCDCHRSFSVTSTFRFRYIDKNGKSISGSNLTTSASGTPTGSVDKDKNSHKLSPSLNYLEYNVYPSVLKTVTCKNSAVFGNQFTVDSSEVSL